MEGKHDDLLCNAERITADAKTEHNVWSDKKVYVKARENVELEAAGSKLEMKEGEIRLSPSGGVVFVMDQRSASVFGFRAERSRTRIRGNVDLG